MERTINAGGRGELDLTQGMAGLRVQFVMQDSNVIARIFLHRAPMRLTPERSKDQKGQTCASL